EDHDGISTHWNLNEKLKHDRHKIVRLRKTVNAQRTSINQRNRIVKIIKGHEENVSRIYGVIISSFVNMVGSLRLAYYLLQHASCYEWGRWGIFNDIYLEFVTIVIVALGFL
ncbi:8536_t:CDS:2, partial [Acaulospora morrowiae]